MMRGHPTILSARRRRRLERSWQTAVRRADIVLGSLVVLAIPTAIIIMAISVIRGFW